MTRMGMCIGLKADKVARYKQLHAAVWPEILAQLSACNVRNYSIFLREPENLLFGYWEYHGADFAADMAVMAADPVTHRWWDLCMPCQKPLPTKSEGEWWARMVEVFHLD
jgi:L-rhamnose mutarotase